MNTNTIERTSTEITVDENRPEATEAKMHAGPVARLLASVSRLAEEHAAYKLGKCDGRRISIL